MNQRHALCVRLAFLASLSCLVVSGCSAKHDSDAPVVAKTDFIKKGDAICQSEGMRGEDVINQMESQLSDAKTEEEFRMVYESGAERLARIVSRERRELDALEPPLDVKRQWRHALAELDAIAKALRSTRETSSSGKQSRKAPIPDTKDTQRFLERYGFKVCAESIGATTGGVASAERTSGT
jgi:hypothetical protein